MFMLCIKLVSILLSNKELYEKLTYFNKHFYSHQNCHIIKMSHSNTILESGHVFVCITKIENFYMY